MNKRIKELAEKARKYARDYVAECKHYGYYMEHNEYELRFEEKFAELIVRECIEHLESSVAVPNIEHSRTKTKCIRSIKEHFGVKE